VGLLIANGQLLIEKRFFTKSAFLGMLFFFFMTYLTYLINFLLVINILVCLLIVLLVLMQQPKNQGLGAAFGGGMTENLFGADTSNVLAKMTRVLGGIFIAICLVLSMLYAYQARTPGTQERLAAKAAEIQAARPSPTPAAEESPAPAPAPEK